MNARISIQTFLDSASYIYTRLVAVAWHGNRLLQPTVFTSDAGAHLLESIREYRTDVPIILECRGLSTVEDHALSTFGAYVSETKRPTIFMVPRSSVQLTREIQSELVASYVSGTRIGETEALTFGSCPSSFLVDASLLRSLCNLEIEFARRVIKESFKPYSPPRRLESTPLLASGILNARSIISCPKKFIWISILLADLFQSVVNSAQPRTTRILAVSLRGSPFAAAVRILSWKLSPSLEVIDHMGPRDEVLEDNGLQIDGREDEYILISDFVIGGTEVKVARTYALSQGATLNNAIAIGSFLRPDQYSKTVTLHSLVQISDAVPELRYEFIP